MKMFENEHTEKIKSQFQFGKIGSTEQIKMMLGQDSVDDQEE